MYKGRERKTDEEELLRLTESVIIDWTAGLDARCGLSKQQHFQRSPRGQCMTHDLT
jgi:hypothetical protein